MQETARPKFTLQRFASWWADVLKSVATCFSSDMATCQKAKGLRPLPMLALYFYPHPLSFHLQVILSLLSFSTQLQVVSLQADPEPKLSTAGKEGDKICRVLMLLFLLDLQACVPNGDRIIILFLGHLTSTLWSAFIISAAPRVRTHFDVYSLVTC